MTHSTTTVFLYQKHRPEYGRFIVGEGIVNTLRTRSFKLFKRPFSGFLIILTL